MRSSLKRRSAVLALVVAGAVVGLLWQRAQAEGDWWLERRLSSLIRDSGPRTFSVSAATGFDWDTMYVFTPYTENHEVERRIGRSWPTAHSVDIEMRDGVVLLVFLNSGDVVAHVAQPRRPGDFSEVPTTVAYTRETALFRVKPRNNWPYLEAVHPSLQAAQRAIDQKTRPSGRTGRAN